ncbi:type II toxin-antitoxin system VapC family toxin [Archaeoglobales archaeon]|nr:MAG: type II toxin-antitoxin system VapC family toxin [Archaeoglobales archaeon]
MGTVLDTNVIIEVARGNESVLKKVLSVDTHFYITTITSFEILVGAPKLKEMGLLNSLERLPFDGRSAEVAADIYKKIKKNGKMMGIRDLFIGSICIAHKLLLATMDRDFELLKKFGLDLVLVG